MGVAIHRGGAGDEPRALAREGALAPIPTPGPLPAPAPPTVPPTTAQPPTTAPPPPPPTAPPAAATPDRSLSGTTPLIGAIDAYRGLGTWVDVYDWSRTYGRGTLVGPADVERMAEAGVQTLYIQTTRWDAPTDVLDPDLLVPMIRRAQARGLRVVAWYLPTL